MTTRMRMSRCRIRFDVFWCSAFFKLLAVCLIARIMTSDAQRNPQGFISIDCGSNSATYQDPETGLIWKNDGHYALTGMNGNISRAYSFQPNLTNHRALQSFRYFPENRGKHCYDLPLPGESTPFLIRAMFLYGASPQLKPPIQFGVYIHANLWFSLKYETDNATDPPDIREGIFYLPNRTIAHVCLVPTTGVPFISSLELRPLDSKGLMYSLTDNDHKALFFTTLLRCSANIAINDSDVRYPDDEYDRLWTAYLLDQHLPDTTAVSALSSNLETNSFVNYVPSKVMLKTWNSSGYSFIAFNLDLPEYTAASTSGTSGRYIYMTLYFYVSDADMGQNMTIYWNEETSHFDVVPSYINTKVFEHHPLGGDFIYLELESESNPSLNAMEVYEETIFSQAITDPDTVSLIDMLKGNFSLTDWQGDPCTPVPYSWVACFSETRGDSETLYIYSVTLSNVTNTSNLRQMLWPPTTVFSLSVIHSDVDDLTLETIMKGDHDDREYIYNMDFSYNKIKSIPISGDLLLWLNLSHNDIGGDFSSFSRSYNRLQYLNMSHNQLTSPPGNLTTGLESLHLVDFSYNRLTSEDSLETLVRTNALHLRHIDFSHNFLTGPFLSDLYISRLPRLEVLNFDQNSITGTLNLRAWSSMLRHAVKTLNISSVQKLFSLVNNSIQDIDPPAEEFQPLLETLIHIPGFNETGFLLGGNPYCQAAKLWTQRYFCRYSIFDQILELPEGDKVNSKFLYAVIPGVLALIFVCVSIALSWKLWRQLRTLQAIQKAIAEREVQPRMYIYRDLKLATRNFHKENELGSGGFGAVYKGVLANGTTVAVKKLFNSQQKQVLHEFLNEVVLITGIKHKNLAQLKGCCITSEKRFLVYEFAEKGNLAEALWGNKRGETLEWEKRFNICVGIARGLSYLHDELHPCIIHRDIKAANILLEKNWVPKIADFGLARPFLEEDAEAHFTHVAGTRGYLAPEYYQGQLTEKVDVYSFGILLLEIVSGRNCIVTTLPKERLYVKTWAEKLYRSGELLELLDIRLKESGSYDESEVIRVINVALICVQIDPKFRATMFQATTMLVENVDISLHLEKAMSHDLPPDFDATLRSISLSNTGRSASRFSALHINTSKWFKMAVVEESEDASPDQTPVESPLLVNSSRSSHLFAEASEITSSLELTKK